MRRLCAILASVLVLSCGGSKSSPTNPTPPPTTATTYTVSGVVRDDKGVPVTEANVYVGCGTCKTGPGFSTRTNAAGFYSGALPAGKWDIFVNKPGYKGLSLYGAIIVAANTTRDLTLNPGVRISGKTLEEGVGVLTGVRIDVIGGPSAGASTVTNSPGVPNAYGLELLPGEHRIRASKDGYDTVERTVQALTDVSNIDFTLKWSHGSCLRGVSPVLFDGYRSSGGEESVTLDVNPGRSWTATPDQSWLEVVSASGRDSGRVTFRILPHPVGADQTRRGAIMIRCSATEGQNVWVVQKPDCQITLTPHSDTPPEFPASGGIGKLRVVTGPARCEWKAESRADWMHTTGVNSWYSSFDPLHFVVSENRTGAPRTGTLIVGETLWTVKQR